MIDTRTAPWAALVLRTAMGIAFLAHGILLKLFTFGLDGTADFFEGIGLPRILAYIVFAVEALGGAALILGIQARWVAAALIPTMLGALWAHVHAGWLFENPGGGWEYPAFWAAALVAQVLLGDGKWAVSPSHAPALLKKLIPLHREETLQRARAG